MDNVFAIAEACLQQISIVEKIADTRSAWESYQQGRLNFCNLTPPQAISAVRFPARPLLLSFRQMPKRSLSTPAGKAAFFHALAHIEFMAIYLAWDILYRFRDLPEQFYIDWLQVADEEAQHFELLRQHLLGMGLDYGDLPAHQGLWDHAQETANDVLARLALVPRCMEARGLDVTQSMIDKFSASGDQASVDILQRILTDEIGHVAHGSYWFKFICAQQDLEPDLHYQHLIEQYYKGGKPKGPFNKELRIMAGFSEAELHWLETEAL